MQPLRVGGSNVQTSPAFDQQDRRSSYQEGGAGTPKLVLSFSIILAEATLPQLDIGGPMLRIHTLMRRQLLQISGCMQQG